MTKKHIFTASLVLLGVVAIATPTFAHVVVTPAQVNIGAFQTFSVGVPSEKPMATVELRLVLPDGLNYVTPNVKQGWKISVQTDDDGQKEIDWTGGNIPANERDDFLFSAQVPTTATALQWKAYQTYEDGTIVSWDLDKGDQPKDATGKPDFSQSGPYSTTNVIDDLNAPTSSQPANYALTLSIIALAFSILAFVRMHIKSKK